jgi:segregation and condensation protein B
VSEPRHMERLVLLEAALYSAGRPVDFDRLKTVIKTKSSKVVRKLIRELSGKYEARGSAMEVKALPEERAVMRLRSQYSKMVKRLTNRPLLTTGPLKTLSYIAFHQPVEQIKVVDSRGNHVYAHIRMMEEMGLITREKSNGRGYVIETTPYFSDYFGFGHDPLKSKIALRQMFSTMKIHKIDNGNGGSYEDDEPSHAGIDDGYVSKAEGELPKHIVDLLSDSDS